MLRLASGVLLAIPVAFGMIRAVTTGTDLRYLWLAAAAIAGSLGIAIVAISFGLCTGTGAVLAAKARRQSSAL